MVGSGALLANVVSLSVRWSEMAAIHRLMLGRCAFDWFKTKQQALLAANQDLACHAMSYELANSVGGCRRTAC